MRRALCAPSAALLLLACDPRDPAPRSESPTPGETVAAREIVALEEPDEPDPAEVRRLARRADPADVATLRRHLLARGEVRRWAAFGLGQLCATDRLGISSALTGAFALWTAEAEPPPETHVHALARALGACASPDTERTLRSWLSPEAGQRVRGLDEAAAFGLGDWLERNGALEERTVTALLDAAERTKKTELLYPLGRTNSLGEALSARTLDVAGALLTQTGDARARSFAILALGSAGAAAALPLSLLVQNRDFTGTERALAVATLARLGAPGQRNLDSTLSEMLGRGLPARATDENWLVLSALARSLERPGVSRRALAELPTAPLPEPSEPAARAQRRRLVALRCRAAELLADANPDARGLADCDPEHGTPAQLAQLAVLGRGKLVTQRATRFDELARRGAPVVLESALRQIPAHPEFAGALELLVHALEQGGPGAAATALSVIAAHPGRVQSGGEPAPDPRVVGAVDRLLTGEPPAPLETVAAALGAVGALGVLTSKPRVEALCDGPQPALWPRAAAALGLLGNPGRVCRGPTPAGRDEPASAPEPRAPDVVTVRLDSELGELGFVLDAADAPFARAWVLSRLEAGYYREASVDGAAPGFAVTWGDRDGDGYENEALPALPDERGPTPWTAGSIGVSSFSSAAASTILLVTVAPAPQLTGQKIRLGSASGPWHLLVPGDVLSNPRIERAAR